MYNKKDRMRGKDIMNDTAEKEIVYQFDILEPESFYTKPALGKRAKIQYMLIQIICLTAVIETIVLMCMDHSSSKFIWLIVPTVYVFHGIKTLLIAPKKRKKNYKKIHDENEDLYSYTFYTDCVNVKTQTMEATFKYDSAEGYLENEEQLIVFFSLKRGFTIDKNQCTEEYINFIKNFVPKDKQKKIEKKNAKIFIFRLSVLVILAIILGGFIGIHHYVSKNTYYLKYPNTTYESFLACLEYGTIDDVLIINDKYIEYTFTGRDEDEKYYTVCSNDIDHLIRTLNDEDVSWETKNAKFCDYE